MKQIIIALAFALIAFGCNKNDNEKPDYSNDNEKPTISLTKPSTDLNYYDINSRIYLSTVVSDNLSLKEIIVSIVKDVILKSATTSWTPLNDTIPLQGTSQELVNCPLFEEIPSDATSGEYKLTIRVFDQNNNEAMEERIIIIH